MSKRKQFKFNIGDWVEFDRIVKTEYNKNDNKIITIYPLKVSKLGQIIGLTNRYTGKYIPGSQYGTYDGYEYEEGHLKDPKAHFLWMVKTGLINKPFLVLEKDLVFVSVINDFAKDGKLPFRDSLPEFVYKDNWIKEKYTFYRND